MSDKTLSILLGGVIPAILLGISGVFQKISTKAGIGTGPYLIGVGITTFILGCLFTVWEKDTTVNVRSASYVAIFGVFWSVAMACIAIALRKFNGQISQLVPLYNMNTLVAVLIGLILLGEWQTVSIVKILAASVLIIVGGVLAATA